MGRVGATLVAIALVVAGCGAPSAADARDESEAIAERVIAQVEDLTPALAEHLGADDFWAEGEWRADWDPKFNRGNVSYAATATLTLPADVDKPMSFAVSDFFDERAGEPRIFISTAGDGARVQARIDGVRMAFDEVWLSGPSQVTVRFSSAQTRAPSEVVDEYRERGEDSDTLLGDPDAARDDAEVAP